MKAKSLIASLFLALAVFTAAASCVKFDDSEIQSELTDIKSRLSKLEEKVNTNIAGLWEIVNAQKNGIQITSVSETDDTWIISFSNGKTATVSKGKSPVIGVARHQGVYYWTLDDEWLLDASGNKLPVSGAPGTTPQLKIDGGYWYVSTDDGKTWTKLGKATGEDGDSFFKEITWDDDYVYLTLQNGTKFELRRGDGLVASIAAIPDYSDGSVKAGTSLFTIRFKVEPESAAESLLYLDTDCFKLSAAYTLTKAAAGDLATLPIYEMEANDGILTILTDGEALADEFAKGKLGVSAALFISDGASLAVNSGYFPLYPKNEYLGYGYVDLGLSVKWATINVGATNPEDYGDYYAWGETETKEDYSWLTYKFRVSGDNFDNVKFDKYCSRSSFWGGTEAMDNKTVLDLEDDAANVHWGGGWRMPTDAEFTELRENCTWTWTNNYNGTGIKGRIVTSKKAGYTDKSIFLPSAGRRDGKSLDGVGFGDGYYWSSTLYTDKPSLSCYVLFSSNTVIWNNLNRIFGMPVRPVLGKYEHKSVTGVSLDRGTLTMVVGSTRQLTATVEPADIKNPKLSWTSSDPGVATVAKDGTVTAVSVGTTTVTVKTVDGGFTATCAVTVISPSDVPAPEAVDLGLSVKWANVNVGAISPEDYGDYFAWGETEPKKEYILLNYKFKFGTEYNSLFSKYVTNSSYGTVDNKTVLDPEDDAAHVNWGGSWRMPTDEECDELINNCTWTWTTENGVNGRRVTGPNGKSIFLPAAGYRYDADLVRAGSDGYYWSSSLDTDDPARAWFVYFYSGNVLRRSYYRWYGLSVRPVYGEFIPVASISLDKTSLELNAGDKQQLTATVSPSNATAKDIHWASSDESIAKVDGDGLVTAVAPGTATITAYGSSGVSASCTVTVKEGAQAVDLGLPSGLKWASCNVGATRPEQFGDYFAWGETEPYYQDGYAYSASALWKPGKEYGYYWMSYRWCYGGYDSLNKYNDSYSSGTTVDGLTTLTADDDPARAVMGDGWRTPTRADWEELLNPSKCIWTCTAIKGVPGYTVTSYTTGNYIFLPAAGFRDEEKISNPADDGTIGYYWSSTRSADPWQACSLFFVDEKDGGGIFLRDNDRCKGYSVRPVYGK